MTLDVRTLDALLAISHLLRVVVLWLQYVVLRSYHGIAAWLFWSVSVAAGFCITLLREVPGARVVSIRAQNSLLVLGVTGRWVGS